MAQCAQWSAAAIKACLMARARPGDPIPRPTAMRNYASSILKPSLKAGSETFNDPEGVALDQVRNTVKQS